MPNVAGLLSADVVKRTTQPDTSRAYGNHCTVVHDAAGDIMLVANDTKQVIAAVRGWDAPKPRVSAKLALIDGDTVSAVNAFLRPWGKVKVYWRTGERRWHPTSGAATKSVSAPKPVAPVTVQPQAAPETNPALAPAVVVESREAQRAARIAAAKSVQQPILIGSTQPFSTATIVVPGEKTHSGGKAPSIRNVTKTYSAVGDVLLPTKDVETLNRAFDLRAAGRPGGVIITGPAGTAKTRLAREFAFSKGIPFLKVDASSIQTANDWYGQFVPDVNGTNGWTWVWTDFALALLRGTPCLILVDELNRAENERALNGLMGLIDFTATFNPVGAPQAMHLPPGILIVATLNEGVEYVGTVEVDAAVRDRFSLGGVRMDYSNEIIEARILRQQVPGLDAEVAKRLVRVAAGQRAKRDDDTLYPSHNVISTRVLIAIADHITVGAHPVDAIWSVLKSKFIKEDEDALNVLIEAQFGSTPEDVSTLPEDADIDQFLADL